MGVHSLHATPTAAMLNKPYLVCCPLSAGLLPSTPDFVQRVPRLCVVLDSLWHIVRHPPQCSAFLQSPLATASFIKKFEPCLQDISAIPFVCVMLQICQVELQLEAGGAKQKSKSSFFRQLLDTEILQNSLWHFKSLYTVRKPH